MSDNNQKHFFILKELGCFNTLFGKLSEESEKLYCKKLEQYPIEIITKAVSKVQETFEPHGRVTFPPIATIVKACKAEQEKHAAISTGAAQSWESKDKEAKRLVRDYLELFMRSTIATDALNENYDLYLRRYAHEVATIQAHIMVGVANIGVLWHLITPETISAGDAWKFRADFMRDCTDQAKRGMIEVAIPTSLIQKWQRLGAIDRVRVAEYVRLTAPSALIPNLPPIAKSAAITGQRAERVWTEDDPQLPASKPQPPRNVAAAPAQDVPADFIL